MPNRPNQSIDTPAPTLSDLIARLEALEKEVHELREDIEKGPRQYGKFI